MRIQNREKPGIARRPAPRVSWQFEAIARVRACASIGWEIRTAAPIMNFILHLNEATQIVCW